MFHGWMFDPDGDQAAADSTRSSTSLDTGSSLNPRTARRLVTASYTSMMAHLQLANAKQPPPGRRDHGRDQRPFGISQIAGIPQAAAIRHAARHLTTPRVCCAPITIRLHL